MTDQDSAKRTVRVIDRSGGWDWIIRSVSVPWVCCTCGQPRGAVYNHNFCEDGGWYSCDRWDNPCGHVDKYQDVLAQWREQAANAANRMGGGDV